MQYRVNPRNGDRISALGLGCMRFPGPPGRPDPRLARELVARALDRGMNYLDTAYLYPGNESCVGSDGPLGHWNGPLGPVVYLWGGT